MGGLGRTRDVLAAPFGGGLVQAGFAPAGAFLVLRQTAAAVLAEGRWTHQAAEASSKAARTGWSMEGTARTPPTMANGWFGQVSEVFQGIFDAMPWR